MIVIVNEDVWCAEEIQDTLIRHGHRFVVVVTHPEGSSLELLRDARVIIIEASRGLTKVVNLMDAVLSAGGGAQVIMIGAAGAALNKMVEDVRSYGLPVVGGVEHLASSTDLSGLVDVALSRPYPMRHSDIAVAKTASAPSVYLSRVVAGRSLDYIGARVRRSGDACGFLEREVSSGAAREHKRQAPEEVIEACVMMQRALERDGHSGMLFTSLPENRVDDAAFRRRLCKGHGFSQATLSRIVVEVDVEKTRDLHSLYDQIEDLRWAGFGVLLRCTNREIRNVDVIANLPITALEFTDPMQCDEDELREALRVLRRQSIGTLCRGQYTTGNIADLSGLGFSLIDVESEGQHLSVRLAGVLTPTHGDMRRH